MQVNRFVVTQVFSDVSVTIEDLMKAKGELVKRGTITEDGHIELFEDSSESVSQIVIPH